MGGTTVRTGVDLNKRSVMANVCTMSALRATDVVQTVEATGSITGNIAESTTFDDNETEG